MKREERTLFFMEKIRGNSRCGTNVDVDIVLDLPLSDTEQMLLQILFLVINQKHTHHLGRKQKFVRYLCVC